MKSDIEAFLKSGLRVAEIDYAGDYNCVEAFRASFQKIIARHNYPAMVFVRKGVAYIARTDIEKEDKPCEA